MNLDLGQLGLTRSPALTPFGRKGRGLRSGRGDRRDFVAAWSGHVRGPKDSRRALRLVNPMTDLERCRARSGATGAGARERATGNGPHGRGTQ